MKPSIMCTLTDLAVAAWARKIMGAETDEDVLFYSSWIDDSSRSTRIPKPVFAATVMVIAPVTQVVMLAAVEYVLRFHDKDGSLRTFLRPTDANGSRKDARP